MLSTKASQRLWSLTTVFSVLLLAGCYGAPMPVNELDPDAPMPTGVTEVTEDGATPIVDRERGPEVSSTETIGN